MRKFLSAKSNVRLFLLVSLILALVTFTSVAESFSVLRSSNLSPARVVELPFKTYHVQGIAVTDDYYFLSAVDKKGGNGWLWKIDRSTLEVLYKVDLATKSSEGVPIIHPGGITYDGDFLWVPMAGYTREGPSIIYKINPDTMEILDKFQFDDHIGGIASNGVDRLYLANWDTVHLYVCDMKGNVIETFINPGLAQEMGYVCAYQDLDYDVENDLLIGSGDTRKPYAEIDGYKFGFPYFHGYADEFGICDWIDPKTGRVIKRIEIGFIGYGLNRTRLGREGFEYYKEKMYFAPEDDCTRIYMYELIPPTSPYIP